MAARVSATASLRGRRAVDGNRGFVFDGLLLSGSGVGWHSHSALSCPRITRSSADVLDFAMNDGSFGHPEVCARPCLFYASGKCDSGSACKFCHLSHVRLGSLKRDLRDHLRQLPTLAAKALILPVIEQKALLFDPSGEVEHAVVHLLQACFAGQEAPSWKKSRRDRALLATFHDMTLRLLLVSLRRSVLDAGDHEAHLAAEALAEQLRAPASPQGRHPKRGLFSL